MTDRHLCAGYPEGRGCLTEIPGDTIWCRSCRYRRQAEGAAGIRPGMVHVGIVLEDFDAPTLACECGGDAAAPDHEFSLLHRKWVWDRSPAATPIVVEPLSLAERRRIERLP